MVLSTVKNTTLVEDYAFLYIETDEGFGWSQVAKTLYGTADSISLRARLQDGYGNPIVGQRVWIHEFRDGIDQGRSFTDLTDANGYVTWNNYVPGQRATYLFKAEFDGDGVYGACDTTNCLNPPCQEFVQIQVVKYDQGIGSYDVTIAADVSSITVGESVVLTITLIAVDGMPMVGKSVHVHQWIDDIDQGRSYHGTTDANGQAVWNYSPSVEGTHLFSSEYDGDALYEPAQSIQIALTVGPSPAHQLLIAPEDWFVPASTTMAYPVINCSVIVKYDPGTGPIPCTYGVFGKVFVTDPLGGTFETRLVDGVDTDGDGMIEWRIDLATVYAPNPPPLGVYSLYVEIFDLDVIAEHGMYFMGCTYTDGDLILTEDGIEPPPTWLIPVGIAVGVGVIYLATRK